MCYLNGKYTPKETEWMFQNPPAEHKILSPERRTLYGFKATMGSYENITDKENTYYRNMSHDKKEAKKRANVISKVRQTIIKQKKEGIFLDHFKSESYSLKYKVKRLENICIHCTDLVSMEEIYQLIVIIHKTNYKKCKTIKKQRVLTESEMQEMREKISMAKKERYRLNEQKLKAQGLDNAKKIQTIRRKVKQRMANGGLFSKKIVYTVAVVFLPRVIKYCKDIVDHDTLIDCVARFHHANMELLKCNR